MILYIRAYILNRVEKKEKKKHLFFDISRRSCSLDARSELSLVGLPLPDRGGESDATAAVFVLLLLLLLLGCCRESAMSLAIAAACWNREWVCRARCLHISAESGSPTQASSRSVCSSPCDSTFRSVFTSQTDSFFMVWFNRSHRRERKMEKPQNSLSLSIYIGEEQKQGRYNGNRGWGGIRYKEEEENANANANGDEENRKKELNLEVGT